MDTVGTRSSRQKMRKMIKKNAVYLSKFVFTDDLSLKRLVNPMIKESDIQI